MAQTVTAEVDGFACINEVQHKFGVTAMAYVMVDVESDSPQT